MSEFTETDLKQARLAKALFSLASDYKNDADVLEHISYICFQIKDAISTPSRIVDWDEMGDYFDRLENSIRNNEKKTYPTTGTERSIERILFEADLLADKN